MSVAVIIDDPVTDDQRLVSIPVASEQVFNELWIPASQELGLEFVPLFLGGVVIGKEELDDVLLELSKLKAWTMDQVQTEEINQMRSRIDRLIDELPKIVSSQTRVFIG
jgi:hypothetical protein